MKVKVECKQVVHYEAEIEMNEREYNLLLERQGGTVSERNDEDAYEVLCGIVSYYFVVDADPEFELGNVEIVEDDAS